MELSLISTLKMYYNTVMFRVISEILPLEEPVIVKSILSFLIATPIKSECCRMIRYTVNGRLHRYDGPAVIHSNGDTEWFQYGKRHRLNGPAVVMVKRWRTSQRKWPCTHSDIW